ncbi:MAG: hypothetical protein ACI4MJ_07465 [Aristaeellaceae bacterium]
MTEATTHPTMPLLPDLTGDMELPQGSGLMAMPEDFLQTLTAHMDAPEDGVNADVLGALRRHQRTLDKDAPAWRGMMAAALLWDTWADTDAELTVREMTGASALSAMVLSALRPADKGRPLHLVVWQHGGNCASLGMLDSQWGILPAVQTADWGVFLPERVTWYDRAAGQWLDPVPLLNERDRAVLIRRLSLLRGEPAQLFAAALTQERLRVSHALEEGTEDALHALTVRAVGVCGLSVLPGLTVREAVYHPGETVNPLLAALGLTDADSGDGFLPQQVWLWQGRPFARISGGSGLESTGAAQEEQTLAQVEEVCAMLALSAQWQQDTARCLSDWLRARETNRDFAPAARTRLHEVQREMARQGIAQQQPVTLHWPWDASSGAAMWLVRQCLGEAFVPGCAEPFSAKLTLLPEAAPDVLGDDVLARACCLPMEAAEMHCPVIPPLSPAMAQVIAGHPACLTQTDFCMTVTEDGSVEASFTLHGAADMTFTRTYAPEELVLLPTEKTPTIAVWPSVAFPEGQWQAYHVYSHGPGLTVRALDAGQWTDAGAHMWSVLRTDTFPRCLTLHQGEVCLGTLLNLLPAFCTAAGEPAVISLDVGMTGVAVAIRQGTEQKPLHLPCLVRTLLHGTTPAPFAEQFLPAAAVESILPATAVLTRDADDPLPLVDGHIAPPTQDDCVLLKWVTGDGKAQRLHLRQVMLTAALYAKMNGAPSATWRMAMPTDLAPVRREALMAELCALAPITAREACLPLTPGVAPVRTLDADTALALYMKGCGYQRGGFLSVDIGSGGTGMMLWLRGMNRPCAVTHLSLGIHGMLLQTLMAQPDALVEDFAAMPDEAARQTVQELAVQLRLARGSRKALERSVLLLDACLGQHLPAMAQHMNDTLARGGMTLMQALLLSGFAWLMTTAGLQMEHAWRDASVNDHLPMELPLCLAGRGSLLLTTMPDTLVWQVARFVHLGMTPDNAVQQVPLMPASAPKMEVALGLSSAVTGLQEQAGDVLSLPDDLLPMDSPDMLLRGFLCAFAGMFPLAAQRLYPGVVEQGRISGAGEDRIRALPRVSRGQRDAASALAHTLEQLRLQV